MKNQKKIMFLGGIYYLKPAIDAAHALGCYVITVDNVPNNIAHQWSDEYVNASIIDKEAILKIAKEKEIDGILSYAVDPGVVTAAYVAEQMGLPFTCSYEAAKILQDKALFRNFLANNGLTTPWALGFSCFDQVIASKDKINYPAIIKPVDSAGSKGVTRVDSFEDVEVAYSKAVKFSISKRVIIEEYIPKQSYSSGAEIFVKDGVVVFSSFYDQLFDDSAPNPYVPTAECWPSLLSTSDTCSILDTVQKICNLLKIQTGIFNLECRKANNGEMYLMELSPRAGGNRLAEMIKCAAGSDIIVPEVQKTIKYNLDKISQPVYNRNYAIMVVHSNRNGAYVGMDIIPEMQKNLISKEIYLNEGDVVSGLGGANNAIGTLFLQFENREELIQKLKCHGDWCHVNIKY